MKPTDPFYPNQPEKAFVVINGGTVGVGVVTRGFKGYGPVYDYTPNPAKYPGSEYPPARERALECAEQVVAKYNRSLGISEAQAEAAQIGSMAGWDAPGADPAWWEKRLAQRAARTS